MSSNKHSHSDLAAAMARVRAAHGLPNAEAEEVELRCPFCSRTAPESEFDEVEEPDTDEDSYRTDPITTSTTNDDDSNKGDRPAEYDNRRISKLNALTKSLTEASNKNK
jgi:hypothetical protein